MKTATPRVMISGVPVIFPDFSLSLSMDTAADEWKGKIVVKPEHAGICRPFGYDPTTVHIDDELMFTGIVYTVDPELEARGHTKALNAYTLTADAVDSSFKPPYEFNGSTLEQIATKLLAPLGIKAVFVTDTGGPFDAAGDSEESIPGISEGGGAMERATASAGETIFGFLSRLAAQRGILVGNTPEGNMLFSRADLTSPPVGVLSEGQPGCERWAASYNGRLRFRNYVSMSQNKGGLFELEDTAPAYSVAVDEHVLRPRTRVFQNNETTDGDVRNSVEWQRSRAIADAMSCTLPVSSWYAPNGKIWRPNTRVTIVSEALCIPKGYDLLIKAVTLNEEKHKKHASIHLTLPHAYTGEPLEDPWRIN